jgi:hypothetical protein
MHRFLPLALLLVPSLAAAQSAPAATTPAPAVYATPAPAPAHAEGKDSLNLSVLGVLFGDYQLTYEHLFDGTNGVILSAGGGTSSSDDSSESHGSAQVGYRWHWQHKQNSGFLGVTLASGYGDGSMTIDDGSGPMTYGMRLSSVSVTGNIGKRWMIGDHVNVTLRAGVGWAHYSVSPKQDSAEARKAADEMNEILTLLPVGLDGELSLGYVF